MLTLVEEWPDGVCPEPKVVLQLESCRSRNPGIRDVTDQRTPALERYELARSAIRC